MRQIQPFKSFITMSDNQEIKNHITNEFTKMYNILALDINSVISNQKLILEGLHKNSKQIEDLRSELEKMKTK